MENVESRISQSPKLNSYVSNKQIVASKPNNQFQVGTVILYGVPIVSLVIESQERLCLAQISNTLLKQYSYNEIHNRRVALGITCVQCTPVQLEVLRRAGAMPVSSRRCGMITRREAERLCKSFLGDNSPPRLPEDFAFSVHHECAWGCRGSFLPSRYNSSRAKCIKCSVCGLFFSPNKFIFHSHRLSPNDKYVQPDAANFNSWRRHMKLSGNPPDELVHAWEDVKAMFNGGTRKRLLSNSVSSQNTKQAKLDKDSNQARPIIPTPQIINYQGMPLPISRVSMDFLYSKPLTFSPFSTFPWLKRNPVILPYENPFFPIEKSYQSAFKPVNQITEKTEPQKTDDSDDEVDIETTDEKTEERNDEKTPVKEAEQKTSVDQVLTGSTAELASCVSNRIWNFPRFSLNKNEKSSFLCSGEIQRNFLNDAGETISKLPPLSITTTIEPVVSYTSCLPNGNSLLVNSDNASKVSTISPSRYEYY